MSDGMRNGTSIALHRSSQDTVAATRAALADQGFGGLTEIDVQTTLEAELGIDIEPRLVLGACHPDPAHRALRAEPDIGLLLPCDVVVGASAVRTVSARRTLRSRSACLAGQS